MSEINLTPVQIAVARELCKVDTLFFAQFFFKHLTGKKFIVSDHHRQICAALDEMYKGENPRQIFNIAPRYGKTELCVKMAIAKGLALNPRSKYIHLSYSEKLALDNSEAVKEIVKLPIYQLLFPDVQIKKGTDAKEKWYTTAGGGVYATAAGGQITGFGAGLVEHPGDEWVFPGGIFIDDPIKPEDAQYEVKRTAVNDRFDSTHVNRINSQRTPIILTMQRTHTEDLSGHLIEKYPEFRVMKLAAIKEDGTPLYPQKHSIEDLYALRQANEFVFETQYQQDPRPKHGLLFPKDELRYFIPRENMKFEETYAYIDVADEGEDYLAMPFGQLVGKDIYITDALFDDGENLEQVCAQLIKDKKPQFTRVESNNGGNFFKRNLEALVPDAMILPVRATTNKVGRIRSASGFIKKHFVFVDPKYQSEEYRKFFDNLTRYTRNGKGVKHDDAPDACAGLARMIANFCPDLFEDFAGMDDLREPE